MQDFGTDPASLITKRLRGNSGLNCPLLLRHKTTTWSCKLIEVKKDGRTKLIDAVHDLINFFFIFVKSKFFRCPEAQKF